MPSNCRSVIALDLSHKYILKKLCLNCVQMEWEVRKWNQAAWTTFLEACLVEGREK